MSDRKTRIGRIRPNEEVLVKTISEPLQEQWMAVEDARDRHADVEDIINDLRTKNVEPSVDQWKEFWESEYEHSFKSELFWITIRRTYGLWGTSLGIRDGFAIVKPPEPKSIIDLFRGFSG